ncbi:hypothetical protein FRC00_004586 [Tulasnella sp. 408]|nr:hypothetical protein FRC00_004586 [Tulasnella sp. 408]
MSYPAPYDILTHSPPAPNILIRDEPIVYLSPPNEDVPELVLRETDLPNDLDFLAFRWSILMMSFAQVNCEETPPNMTFGYLNEAGQYMLLQPVLAVANYLRARSYRMLLAENRKSHNDITFMLPESLNATTWTKTPPLDIAAPEIRSVVTFSALFPGRDVIFTDSKITIVAHVPQTNAHLSERQELIYKVFSNLESHPVRLIIGSFLRSKLEQGQYFYQPPTNEIFTLLSGALNHPDERCILEENAMRLWSQKHDINWYTACNDAAYRAVVSRWMQSTLSTFQGKPFLSRGDVLRGTPFVFNPCRHHLEPIYEKKPLPFDTANYLEDIRRDTDDRALRAELSKADSFEVRILDEVDLSNMEDGSSFACEVLTIGGVPRTRETIFRIKIFDDRRMGDPELIEIKPDDRQWFYNATWTHSDVLVALEDAAYYRLDHAQGSIIMVPISVLCWAILTELVGGDTPQLLPRDSPLDMKDLVVVGLRHVLKVFQYAEVSKPLWRFGDLRIRFPGGPSADAPMQACTIVNLWRAGFSTLHGRNEPSDDYMKLWRMLSLAFGEDIVIENFAEQEVWDFDTWTTNQYVGIDWKHKTMTTNCTRARWKRTPGCTVSAVTIPLRLEKRTTIAIVCSESLDGANISLFGWLETFSKFFIALHHSDARGLNAFPPRSSRYVALKMLQGRRVAAMDEQEVLDIITKDSLAWNHIAEPVGSFVHDDPNGQHSCIVFEVLGPTVRDLVKDNPKQALSAEQVKRIARQLLLALQCCHRQGIIHKDIKPSNLMVVLPDIESYLDPTEVEGIPVSVTTDSLSDARKYYPVTSQPIKAPIPDDFVIKLVDFGSAQKADGTTSLWPIQPQLLRAPEVILDTGWGASADIWNFACLVLPTRVPEVTTI